MQSSLHSYPLFSLHTFSMPLNAYPSIGHTSFLLLPHTYYADRFFIFGLFSDFLFLCICIPFPLSAQIFRNLPIIFIDRFFGIVTAVRLAILVIIFEKILTPIYVFAKLSGIM